MMRDVTDLLNNYRECVRGLWNVYFRPLHRPEDLASRDPDTPVDHFERVERSLFTVLVLRPIGKAKYRQQVTYKTVPFLCVVPAGEGRSLMVNRERGKASGYWDHQVAWAASEGADFRFDGCFDWDDYGYREMRYYMVRIDAFPAHPECVGRHALIAAQEVRVLFDDDAADDGDRNCRD